MSESDVTLERHGSAALITLNAPERRNIMTGDLVRALGRAYDEAETDDGVLCVVLTGAGSAFCAGADLQALEDAAHGGFESVRSVYDGFLRVLASPLPTIGAVNGPAVGAGINLALACDVRLASPAARFDTRFAALGLHPGGGHTWLLTRAVGPQQAMLGCLFGQAWDADTALRLGLVAAVHPVNSLVPAALGLAGELATHSPEYVRRLTATLRFAAAGASHADVLARETEAQEWTLGQPEFLAGLERIRARIAARRTS